MDLALEVAITTSDEKDLPSQGTNVRWDEGAKPRAEDGKMRSAREARSWHSSRWLRRRNRSHVMARERFGRREELVEYGSGRGLPLARPKAVASGGGTSTKLARTRGVLAEALRRSAFVLAN